MKQALVVRTPAVRYEPRVELLQRKCLPVLPPPFAKPIPAARPALLLLDGYNSQFDVDALQFAADNQIIVLALPAHWYVLRFARPTMREDGWWVSCSCVSLRTGF